MANVSAAKQFVKDWTGRGDEKQDTQAFWIQLMDKVFEDHDYNKDILFEQTADKIEGGKFFKDAVIFRYTDHAVLVEQKGMKYELDQKEPRHGLMLTPFEQAKEYDDKSAANDKARWIITCNFKEFWIYDNYKTGKALYEPVARLKLEDLPKHLDWLSMLEPEKQKAPDFTEEVDVSVKAGELVGILYNDLHKNYKDPDDPETLRQLNILCVRIVFCLYAEDAGLFDKNNRKMFHDYLAQFDAQHMRKALASLFQVLAQKEEDRDPYLADDDPMLAAFPYVNGGLFEGEVTIPPFTDETADILLNKESLGFDWSKISPTIFGAVFESTLNQETRRSGGMHYTSIENIHKVIDPLFLDDLKAELNDILSLKTVNTRNKRLREFQVKLSQIRCFDPACGSGNFLTESYLSLRRLENEALKAQLGQRIAFGFEDTDLDPIKVSIQQFYGIEINDFAVSVAKTALWIAEAQMFEETQTILNGNKDFFPLATFTNIHEGNALRMDWNTVVDRRTENLYIMGNPPFVGNSRLSEAQKQDRDLLFDNLGGELDYVACWYKKASDYILGTDIKCAFVSTNSICQGQQVPPLWKPLFKEGIRINFAYRTFVWDSEASIKAHVYCIIIGFSMNDGEKKRLYDKGTVRIVDNINGYLADADNVFVERRKNAIGNNVPIVIKGFQPTDNGNLILDDAEKAELLKNEPDAIKWIRPFITAREYLYRKTRWCLWLVGASPAVINELPFVKNRVIACKKWREQQKVSGDAYKLRNSPALMRSNSKFHEDDFIVLPRVSGERREYVPFGFVKKGAIPGDSVMVALGAQLFHFSILESSVHMAWMRAICGRLKGDYRYSSDIVYNNFPWPELSDEKKAKLSATGGAILEVRESYPDSSYNDLYDPDLMPIDLKKAHAANDRAVMAAYGFSGDMSEPDIVAELMKMYQKLTEKKE